MKAEKGRGAALRRSEKGVMKGVMYIPNRRGGGRPGTRSQI